MHVCESERALTLRIREAASWERHVVPSVAGIWVEGEPWPTDPDNSHRAFPLMRILVEPLLGNAGVDVPNGGQLGKRDD
jgi:hypothetical protein